MNSGKYVDNLEVMTAVLELLTTIIKEIVDSLPNATNLPDTMELISFVREDFGIIFSYLPSILQTEYLNPILSIPDLLSVLSNEL